MSEQVSEEKEASPESVEASGQNDLTLVWRCSGWLDAMSDRLKALSPETAEMASYYSDALEALGERIQRKITSDLNGTENHLAPPGKQEAAAAQVKTADTFYAASEKNTDL